MPATSASAVNLLTVPLQLLAPIHHPPPPGWSHRPGLLPVHYRKRAGIAERSATLRQCARFGWSFDSPFAPLARMIGGEVDVGDATVYPVVAPALLFVGGLMLRQVARIPWNDPTEAIPAFLTLITMPLAFSITEGIALGFISYSLLKLATRRTPEVRPLVYVLAGAFVLRYMVLPASNAPPALPAQPSERRRTVDSRSTGHVQSGTITIPNTRELRSLALDRAIE